MPFEALIKAAAAKDPKLQIPYELLYAQVDAESSFNPQACSHCGARGLLQLEPTAGLQVGLKECDFFDPEKNLNAGAAYLRIQYRNNYRFITTLKGANNMCETADYWMLALASYNGGFGYVLKALNLCIQDSLSIRWENVATMLADPRCQVKGKRPDYKQMRGYVEKIFKNYRAAISNSNTEVI